MFSRSRLALAACLTASAGLSAIPIASASGPSGTRSLHADLKVLGQANPQCHGGVCVIHNHGSGSLSGFGRVTFTTAITDDTRTSPCPGGSWVPRLRRVIHTSKGNLVLNEAGLVCVQPNIGPRVDLVWAADGAHSTGVFSHASGTGTDHAYLKRDTAVQTGRITLAR